MAEDSKGWIGVDLDGSLAMHEDAGGADEIGAPILPMLQRVKRWRMQGIEVRIVTARVASINPDRGYQRGLIEAWCKKHLGEVIPVTAEKDFRMIQLWDDRAVQLIPNTGQMAVHAFRKEGS
jgi:hypothetical protein